MSVCNRLRCPLVTGRKGLMEGKFIEGVCTLPASVTCNLPLNEPEAFQSRHIPSNLPLTTTQFLGQRFLVGPTLPILAGGAHQALISPLMAIGNATVFASLAVNPDRRALQGTYYFVR